MSRAWGEVCGLWGRRVAGETIDRSLPASTAEGTSSGGPFLCGALETSVVLLQWYQPMNKFLLVRVGSLETLGALSAWVAGAVYSTLPQRAPRTWASTRGLPQSPQGSAHLEAPPLKSF